MGIGDEPRRRVFWCRWFFPLDGAFLWMVPFCGRLGCVGIASGWLHHHFPQSRHPSGLEGSLQVNFQRYKRALQFRTAAMRGCCCYMPNNHFFASAHAMTFARNGIRRNCTMSSKYSLCSVGLRFGLQIVGFQFASAQAGLYPNSAAVCISFLRFTSILEQLDIIG